MNGLTDITANTNVDDLGACDWKPKCGMEFDSEKDAYDFYNAYGGRVGFSIRKDSYNKNRKTGEMTLRIFVCFKEGVRAKDKRDHLTKNPRHDVRTGCQARMGIKLNRRNNKFTVNDFKEENNHSLVIPDRVHMLPSQRKMSASQTIKVELAEESGIPLRSAYELMGRQAGGKESLGYAKLDQKNYLRTKRQRSLAFGEAGSVLRDFQRQCVDNPSFFYAVQLDIEEQITNIFWTDAKMIIDYHLFGDVVSFDTTYKINKENRPFAVFVGFNHHRETVVFGATLMYDETADSFIWLFESFLDAMSNKAPKTIFTDQDAAMAKAILNVMPTTYHRLCKWHLMQNALKYISVEVRGDLSYLMFNVDDEKDFIAAWDNMLVQHEMCDNHWLKLTFGIRKKWAWTYIKMAWSAGMKSTQLSESFNRSLKDYLKSDHDLMQFFMHFERVLNDKRYKELEAEYSLYQKLPKVKVPVTMLIHAGNMYTHKIFEKFQKQYVWSLEAYIKTVVEDGENCVYTVMMHGYPREWQVTKGRDNILSCNCRLFEMRGILCSHAIKVLRDVMNMMELPSHYILKRWTRKARVGCVQDMHGCDIQADTRLQQSTWYRSLCSIFTRISSRASECEETYKFSHEKAKDLLKIIEDMLSLQMDSTVQDQDNNISLPITSKDNVEAQCLDNAHVIQAKGIKKKATPTHRGSEDNIEAQCLDNAHVIQAKGLKKKLAPIHRGRRRIKSSLEIALTKKKKSSKRKSLEDTSIPIDNATDVYTPCPPPPSHSSEIPFHMLHMSGNNLYPPTMYHTYHGCEAQENPISYGFQFQDSQLLNSTSCSQIPFQALLQQNPVSYGFPFQDSQTLNSTACSQAMNLNTYDNLRTTTNCDHFGSNL